MLGIDYSQIELRVMADMSQDNLLMEDFQTILIFIKRLVNFKEEGRGVTKERSLGKTVNFGILFGQTPFG